MYTGENRYSSCTWEQEWKQWIPTSGYLESQAKSSPVGTVHIQNSLYEVSNKSYKSQNSGLQNKSPVRILPELLSFESEVHGCSRQFLSVDEGSGHKRSPFQTQTMSQTPHWEEPRCSRTSWPEYRGNGLYLLGPAVSSWSHWATILLPAPLSLPSLIEYTTKNNQPTHTHFLTGIFPSALSCIFSFTRLWKKNSRWWKFTCTVWQILLRKEQKRKCNWERKPTVNWKTGSCRLWP